MRETIGLYRDGGCWMMRLSNPDFVRLFGSDIQTHFGEDTSPRVVKEHIQTLNPDCLVFVAEVD